MAESAERSSSPREPSTTTFPTKKFRYPSQIFHDTIRSKTRVNIGPYFARWCELKELKGLKSHADVATFLLNRYDKCGPPTSTPSKRKEQRTQAPAMSSIAGSLSPDRSCTHLSSRMMQAGVCLRRDTVTTLELNEQPRIRQREEELSGLESVHMAESETESETECAALGINRLEPECVTAESETESETECAALGLNRLEPECVTAHSGVSDVHLTHSSLIKTKTETGLGSPHTGDLKTESLNFTELEHLTRLHPDQIKTEADDGKYLPAGHASDLQDIKRVKIEFDGIKCESGESSVGDVMNTTMSGAGVDHKDQTEPWQCTGNPNSKKEINNLPTQCGDLSHHGDVHNEYNDLRNIQERPNNANISAHCQTVTVIVEPMPMIVFINVIPISEIHTDISHKTKLALNEHLRGHADDKSYKCAQCKKDFRSHSKFIVHQRTHTGEKPYKCVQCGKGFFVRSAISRHLRTHTGEKPHKCTQCEKCFYTKSELNTHFRTHTGEKPYKCTQCDKCFCTKSQLKTHFRIHTVEKPCTFSA